jgi:hypothetical protein
LDAAAAAVQRIVGALGAGDAANLKRRKALGQALTGLALRADTGPALAAAGRALADASLASLRG